MVLRPAQDARSVAGVTLLEILVAMLVIGLVATGIITAFIFNRRVTWRSGTELFGSGLVTEVAENLRGAVAGPLSNGLSLDPGIYADQNMPNPPAGVSNPRIAGLNFPDDFRRFQDPASGVAGATVAAANHGDGRVLVVEDAPVDANNNGVDDPGEIALVDKDGDGLAGLDLDRNGTTDLRRVRIRMKWTSPTA